MGVYTRFKKQADGFRTLVELLESTPLHRRQKMIEVGLQEDQAFTEKALSYTFSFQDILQLPELELAEVLSEAAPHFVGIAISPLAPEIQNKILSKAPNPKTAATIRESMERTSLTKTDIASSQTKLVEAARKLEKKGAIKTKRIPMRVE